MTFATVYSCCKQRLIYGKRLCLRGNSGTMLRQCNARETVQTSAADRMEIAALCGELLFLAPPINSTA
jgi:hypothetical protein